MNEPQLAAYEEGKKAGYLSALRWIDTLWESPMFEHDEIQRAIRRGIVAQERFNLKKSQSEKETTNEPV